MTKEINSIDLGRMNNGAHFLYITHIATRSIADITRADALKGLSVYFCSR